MRNRGNQGDKGTLYIVATPIGNLEDITLRAVRILSEVDVILAEDTRVTKKLLDCITARRQDSKMNGQLEGEMSRSQDVEASSCPDVYSHHTPSTVHHPQLLSYHQHSDERKMLEIMNMLVSGKNIALVTDAGTPGVSDPGNELISLLTSHIPSLNIVPIPGPSSITAALSVCGFNTAKFTFIGFIPKKKSRKLLSQSLELGMPVVFFESPYRILKTLKSMEELKLNIKSVFIAQELTKVYEKGLRGTLSEVIERLEAEEKELGRVKGEIVVIIDPK
jgi:16S rRNA (cytidine1402-2'-O)-methyltransferase